MTGPNARLDISKAGLDMIAQFEGVVLHLYEDVAGHASIGVGHLVHTGNITDADRKGPFGKGITRQQAMDLLHKDAQRMVTAVRDAVTVPLNQAQFDALVSFTFNVGAGALRKSTLLQRVNAKEFAHCEEAFLRFNKAGGKVFAGLTRRRQAEADLFAGKKGGTAPKPPPPHPQPTAKHWPPSRVLKRPLHGDDVKELQRRLKIKADGAFGKDTEDAVKAFQRKHGLDDDGKVGTKTAAKL
jgi:GH24 family phage-related lysozyme (muramidase)